MKRIANDARVAQAASNDDACWAVLVDSSGKRTRISAGERVRMPSAAGGITGTLDSVAMLLDQETSAIVFAIRVVDEAGAGHQFYLPEEARGHW